MSFSLQRDLQKFSTSVVAFISWNSLRFNSDHSESLGFDPGVVESTIHFLITDPESGIRTRITLLNINHYDDTRNRRVIPGSTRYPHPLLTSMTAARIEPYTLPIADRPQRTWGQTLNAILFGITFNVGCLVIHSIQVVILMPLLVLPFGCTKHLYQEGVRYTKGSFATLLSELSQAYHATGILMTLVPSPDEPMFCPNSTFCYV